MLFFSNRTIYKSNHIYQTILSFLIHSRFSLLNDMFLYVPHALVGARPFISSSPGFLLAFLALKSLQVVSGFVMFIGVGGDNPSLYDDSSIGFVSGNQWP